MTADPQLTMFPIAVNPRDFTRFPPFNDYPIANDPDCHSFVCEYYMFGLWALTCQDSQGKKVWITNDRKKAYIVELVHQANR